MSKLYRRLFPKASYTSAVATILFSGAAATLYMPQALAFEHKAQFGDVTVYSAETIPDDMDKIVNGALTRLSESELNAELPPVSVFLTEGGPRWRFLSFPSGGSFAVTRPGGRHMVINRSEDGAVQNGRTLGGERPLDDVIAHEFVHILIDREFGIFGARWLDGRRVEGFADAVAGGSSLTDAQADDLLARGEHHPALQYSLARREAEAVLASSVDVQAWLRGD